MTLPKCTKCGRKARYEVDFRNEGEGIEPRCGFHSRYRCGGDRL